MPENRRISIGANNEEHERDLNVNRVREQREASAAAIARLNDLGIVVDDDATSDTVADLLEAVEAFEHAVEAAGGDLMVDTPPSRVPDDPRFVLPRRFGDESVADYIARLRRAAHSFHDPLT